MIGEPAKARLYFKVCKTRQIFLTQHAHSRHTLIGMRWGGAHAGQHSVLVAPYLAGPREHTSHIRVRQKSLACLRPRPALWQTGPSVNHTRQCTSATGVLVSMALQPRCPRRANRPLCSPVTRASFPTVASNSLRLFWSKALVTWFRRWV